jgi:amino acid transporter
MWGYSDVGADIYAALGLVMAAAQGAANLSFALAGLVYIMIGLAYTELASAYPVAGAGSTSPCAAWATSGAISPGWRSSWITR